MRYLFFLRVLPLITLHFFLLHNPAYGEEGITEEFVVRVLSGEKRELNYRGQKEPKKTTISSGISFKINFDYDSSEIKESSYNTIIALGKTLESTLFTKDRFKIIGHTDSTGTEKYNNGLSLRRAESVKQMLSEFFSVEAKRLLVTGMGEKKPIATNESETGRAKNRRVEIIKVDAGVD